MVATAGAVRAAAVLGALLLDHAFGEPPRRWHPVVWMGRWLGAVGPRIEGLRPAAAFVGGALAWCLGAAASVAVAVVFAMALHRTPAWAQALGLALLLKPLFAWRMLRDEVAAVDAALAQGLPEGRARLARLVSRDVSALQPHEVREAAIETLAENFNDSVAAPLLWFAIAGLPAAALYRFANTADAMWGYRDRREWSGKWAARADDVLSWLPARVSALLLCTVAGQWPRELPVEARRTPSPNGGWPMGAMALLLGVRLSKPGVYALNAEAPPPAEEHLARALAWSGRASVLAAVVAAAVAAVHG